MTLITAPEKSDEVDEVKLCWVESRALLTPMKWVNTDK
jgi:hypothetical protein